MPKDPRPDVPTVIGGGHVLCYARIDESNAKRNESAEILYGLAICAGADNGVFLFECEDDWIPISKTWHAGINEAKRRATINLNGTNLAWERPPA